MMNGDADGDDDEDDDDAADDDDEAVLLLSGNFTELLEITIFKLGKSPINGPFSIANC